MNRYLLSLISLATLGLQAAEFSHKVEIIPAEINEAGQKTYEVNFLIEKKADENSAAEVVATPKLICLEGVLATANIGSDDDADYLAVTALIPVDTTENKAKITVLVKQANQVVLSSEKDDVKISN